MGKTTLKTESRKCTQSKNLTFSLKAKKIQLVQTSLCILKLEKLWKSWRTAQIPPALGRGSGFKENPSYSATVRTTWAT